MLYCAAYSVFIRHRVRHRHRHRTDAALAHGLRRRRRSEFRALNYLSITVFSNVFRSNCIILSRVISINCILIYELNFPIF